MIWRERLFNRSRGLLTHGQRRAGQFQRHLFTFLLALQGIYRNGEVGVSVQYGKGAFGGGGHFADGGYPDC